MDGLGLGDGLRPVQPRRSCAAQPLPTETTVRPFVIALGYLLGGFNDFQLLGTFNRLHLAQLVFGDRADPGGA